MRCARCHQAGVVEIKMRVGESEVRFRRCHRCEHQGWEGAGGPVPLGAVLDLARVRR
jgi:hypothetical protein